jgi:protein arginine kinase
MIKMLNWYLQTGKESDVVVSTRIRLARNIIEYPFVFKITKQDALEIIDKLGEIIPKIGHGLKLLKLKDIDDVTIMSLIEKHILSPEFALNNTEVKAIAVNEDENICIMINEEDHLRIQVFSAGLELESLLSLIQDIDKVIENELNYAYTDKYGFLTSCPTNVGTALRASVMVHLPALTLTGNISKILETGDSFGMTIRGIYGEGSTSKGNMYQVSNKQTLGISEEEIVKNIKLITEKIIEQERLARKYLAKSGIELEDKIYRAFGLLTNCKKISSEECSTLLSQIRLGCDLGIIKELTDLKVNKLEIYTKPANLQKYYGNVLADTNERDIKRSEIIKKIVSEN